VILSSWRRVRDESLFPPPFPSHAYLRDVEQCGRAIHGRLRRLGPWPEFWDGAGEFTSGIFEGAWSERRLVSTLQHVPDDGLLVIGLICNRSVRRRPRFIFINNHQARQNIFILLNRRNQAAMSSTFYLLGSRWEPASFGASGRRS